jgi:SAM-dependent methyltransferase
MARDARGTARVRQKPDRYDRCVTGRPAGDFDYESRGAGYAVQRRADPRIAARLHDALGEAATVVNVGAGAGSYEPSDRYVVAVEPSPAMRAQRPSRCAPAIDSSAESLPFDDDSFDAAMATITLHQWPDKARGLRELRRVARGPIVILTFDPHALERFWLADYAPELIAAEKKRYPEIAWLTGLLGGSCEAHPIPVPSDCTDGFTEAYFGRPERLLEDDVRRAQSAWGFVERDTETRAIALLREDLASGAWDAKYGELREQREFHGSLCLIVASAEPLAPDTSSGSARTRE